MFTRRAIAALVFAGVLRAELPHQTVAKIQKAVTEQMSKASIPGVAVGIATGGELQYSAGFGMADIENFVPMTSSSRLRIASISKSFTAVAVMQLVEQGKIDLDAQIQKYVPQFPEKRWPVTVRQLLGHVAGVRHYNGLEMNTMQQYTDSVEPLRLFADEPLLFEPGTKYSYSTYGFTVLGAAVERVSGMKLIEYFRKNIFGPAGLTETRNDSLYELIPHRSRGYALEDGKLQNCLLQDTSGRIAGGGLISTAPDLVKFALALNRGALVKKETLALMSTPQTLKDGRKVENYGLGLALGNFNGVRWYGHTGGQRGTQTNLLVIPDKGIVITTLFNLEATPVLIPLAKALAEALQ